MKGMVIRMTTIKRRLTGAVVCLLTLIVILASSLPKTAIAENEESKSLTLVCRRDETILQGMDWKLYKVGERIDGELVLTGDFASYPVYLKDTSASAITSAAKALESFAVADKITPLTSGKTNSDGELTFEGLDNGLYLADGTILQVGNMYYVPSSLLIEISDSDDVFSYDAYPKFYYATLNAEATAYSIKKVWVGDDENNEDRPVDITVDIFRNDEYWDTVVLNESNNWFHHWTETGSISEWTVAERDIPVNYDVAIFIDETQYLVQNSYGREIATTTTTSTTVTTASQTTETSDTTTTAASAQTTTVTTKPKDPLISTGQLKWPIIPLAAGGILLIGIGFVVKPKKEKNEE